MRSIRTGFTVALLGLGLGLYVATGMQSVTVLIPVFLGLVFGICALVATTERRRMHAMHAAVILPAFHRCAIVGTTPT